jgi:hypothetical protein
VELKELTIRGPSDAVELGWASYYEVANVDPYPNARYEFHEPAMYGEHSSRIGRLVTAEGPVHERYLATRLARAFGLQRTGDRIWEAVIQAIDAAKRRNEVNRRGSFIWPATYDLTRVRVPDPSDDLSQRNIEWIPPEEIDLALLRIAEAAETIESDGHLTIVARIFGFERTGGVIQATLGTRQEVLVGAGRLTRSGKTIGLGPKAALPRPEKPADSGRAAPGSRVRHQRLGVGTILSSNGTIVTVDFAGDLRQIDTALVDLPRVIDT